MDYRIIASIDDALTILVVSVGHLTKPQALIFKSLHHTHDVPIYHDIVPATVTITISCTRKFALPCWMR